MKPPSPSEFAATLAIRTEHESTALAIVEKRFAKPRLSNVNGAHKASQLSEQQLDHLRGYRRYLELMIAIINSFCPQVDVLHPDVPILEVPYEVRPLSKPEQA